MRIAADCVYRTLWRLFITEGYLLEWTTAGFVLGVNYGVTSRVPVTLRLTVEQALSGGVVRDPSLLRPYTDADTISGNTLFGLSFGLPAAMVVILNTLQSPARGDAAGRLGAQAVARGTRDVHHLMLSLLQAYALATCWKNWLNKGVGRERPDWYGRLATGDKTTIAEGRASYPSGHAAYSHMAGAVCFWWLAGRMGVWGDGLESGRSTCSLWTGGRGEHLQMLRLLVALIPVGIATYIATTRLTDGVHHFSDVNAGTFIGICCGSIAFHLNYNAYWASGGVHAPRIRGEVTEHRDTKTGAELEGAPPSNVATSAVLETTT